MSSIWWFSWQTSLALNCCTLPPQLHLILCIQWHGKVFLPFGCSTKSPKTWHGPIAFNFTFIAVCHFSASGDTVGALWDNRSPIPSSWLSEIAAAVWMGIISLNSSSSKANCAISANVPFPLLFLWLPSVSGFHPSRGHVLRPAKSAEFLIGFGSDLSYIGSESWLSEFRSPVGCQISNTFFVIVDLGSSITSL